MHGSGKLYMASVCLQFWGANANRYYEYYVSPIDDPNRYPGANFLNSTGVPLGMLGYFHSHSAAAALLPYFIQWYKTGIESRIADDTVLRFTSSIEHDHSNGVNRPPSTSSCAGRESR